jgi:hypothetical protein
MVVVVAPVTIVPMAVVLEAMLELTILSGGLQRLAAAVLAELPELVIIVSAGVELVELVGDSMVRYLSRQDNLIQSLLMQVVLVVEMVVLVLLPGYRLGILINRCSTEYLIEF